MTQATEPTTVTSSIEVAASLQRAFEVFTRDFGAFKPATHNLLAVPIAETVVETHPWRPHHRPGYRWLRMSLGSHPCL